jgi:hypothetical protein
MRQWFLNIFGSLLKKILNKKILLLQFKHLRILKLFPWLTITVIGWVSPRDHLSLDKEKSQPKYTCQGRFAEQFSESHPGNGASFTVTDGFLYAATSSLKMVTGRIFKISKWFQRSKPRLYLPFSP